MVDGRMGYLHASLLLAGGIVVVAYLVLARKQSAHVGTVLPVQAFLAMALFALGAVGLMKGPLRIFHGPPLLVFVLVGASYGALAVGACLAFPERVPKPLQTIFGVVCVGAGVVSMLLQLRVIKPI